MVTTATAAHSFEETAKLLEITADLEVSPRHLQTLCQEVGGEHDVTIVSENMAKTGSLKKNYGGWTIQKKRKPLKPKED